MTNERVKSRVPALSKGLDILELLAQVPHGLSQKDVAERAGRSVSEVFRILVELEERGYIARDPVGGLYTLTLRLFELAHLNPPTKRLITVAMGRMEMLASQIASSCHLVMRQHDKLIVIAQAQPDTLLMGWSVRVGAVFPCKYAYASARTIVAHQLSESLPELIAELTLDEPPSAQTLCLERLALIREQGYEISSSGVVPGITDISCPILNHLGVAIAALTVPIVGYSGSKDLRSADSSDQVYVPALKAAAQDISRAIGGSREAID